MMLAAFAAVGGIASTYINMIGDLFQSLFGFAGATQWAAGLHIIWLVLAAVIIQKPGAASIAGILKGALELFSGNTHGILVVIVDIVAGVIIDLVFLIKRKATFNFWNYLAAGLASASNVLVFQLFAALPSDMLTFIAVAAASFGAFLSGILFGGLLVKSVLLAVEKAGFYKPGESQKLKKGIWPTAILIFSIVLITFLTITYQRNASNDGIVSIRGEIQNPFMIGHDAPEFDVVEISILQNGVMRDFNGIQVSAVLEHAQPLDENGVVLVLAADGYSYYITMEEINSNSDLILTIEDAGKRISMNIVGATSPKAWVRGVSDLIVASVTGVEITGKVKTAYLFLPQDFQEEMDSAFIETEPETRKLQGVLLNVLVDRAGLNDQKAVVSVISTDGKTVEISVGSTDYLQEQVRIFVVPGEKDLGFLLGSMDGRVLLNRVTAIEIK